MNTSVEELEDNKVKLSIEVDEQEFEKAIDAAFRKIAREVNIPGFRRGKAPRRLLEARLEVGVARSEALREAIPDYYAKAVSELDVDVIAAPEINITDGEEEGPVAFEAVVEVRPIVQVPGYESLRITIPAPVASDEEIDIQIDRMRAQHADLVLVDRAAVEGDYATIDIHGSQNDEPLEGLTAQDYSYEIGSGGIVPELDEALVGVSAGNAIEFDADHPDPDDDPLHFSVKVKDVKERVLPEPTDEWAGVASEFTTIAELRDDLASRMTMVRKMQAQMSINDKASDALADLVDVDIPDALVSGEMQQRLQDFAMRLQAQGMTLDQWLANSGQDSEDFIESLRDTARRSAKFDLALRAVVEAEHIEVNDDELEAEYAKIAEQLQLKPTAVRKQFEEADQVSALKGDIARGKAMAFIIETVEIVDEEGNVIDRADLEPPPELDPAPSVADAVDADSVEDSIEVAGTTDAETDTEEGTK
ncbi:MAG: trigger factor [Actinomycetes bacterium]